jgi:hypothetical protein
VRREYPYIGREWEVVHCSSEGLGRAYEKSTKPARLAGRWLPDFGWLEKTRPATLLACNRLGETVTFAGYADAGKLHVGTTTEEKR